ncbi:MAG: TfoX/Sxy family protein [Propionivibrio sp.]|uniref:TfoX/Sxy family protein n=1 Tax=Propionivibrio sp. TaxID=2212460 RepID=UPI001A55BEB9|nr:TfoX/Sxy family protein [Propionivibrio sp.]MBL8414122.1 TfoX/Sxy family protein [Propionivibrio sp.]
MAEPKSIADLRNLGPKSQEMLTRAGVGSIAQLRALGSVPAYVMAKRANRKVSLNLLWALESALSGESWQEVARLHRTSLLLAVEVYEKNGHGNAE